MRGGRVGAGVGGGRRGKFGFRILVGVDADSVACQR